MWAKPLGDDLFELQNIPFYSYEVNFGDIVHAVSDVPEHWPTMDRVVTTSGNQTVRVIFKNATEEQKKCLLSQLNTAGANYENADSSLYGVNIPPTADYDAICKLLDEALQEESFEYETCKEKDKFGNKIALQ